MKHSPVVETPPGLPFPDAGERPSDASSFRADPGSGADSAVEVRDLWFEYRRREPVLRSVSLGVPPGGLTMLLGASGSGKTTLLKLVKGLLTPQRGEIELFGAAPPPGRSRQRLDPRVAYIPQQLGLVRSRSVMDNALMGSLGRLPSWRGLLGLFPEETIRLAEDTLQSLGIAHKAADKVRSLSGGERQRVAIARALVQRPRLLVADEFVSQLDPATSVEIMALVQGIARDGVTVLMTTHEFDLVERFADRVVVLRSGEKVVDCDAGEVRTAELATLMKP